VSGCLQVLALHAVQLKDKDHSKHRSKEQPRQGSKDAPYFTRQIGSIHEHLVPIILHAIQLQDKDHSKHRSKGQPRQGSNDTPYFVGLLDSVLEQFQCHRFPLGILESFSHTSMSLPILP